jgi:hypothetical protein
MRKIDQLFSSEVVPLAIDPKAERLCDRVRRAVGGVAPERRSQLDRIVITMLRDALAYEAKQDDQTSN